MAAIASVLFLTDAWADDRRDVVNVEKVNVEVAVGHAPRLPYQLWVTYGDGSGTMDMIERAQLAGASPRQLQVIYAGTTSLNTSNGMVNSYR